MRIGHHSTAHCSRQEWETCLVHQLSERCIRLRVCRALPYDNQRPAVKVCNILAVLGAPAPFTALKACACSKRIAYGRRVPQKPSIRQSLNGTAESRQGRGIPLCVLQEADSSLDAALWRLRALSQPAASDAAVLAGRQLQARSSMQVTPCQDSASDRSYFNGHLCLPDRTQHKSYLLPMIQVESVSATWRADLHAPPIPMARHRAHDWAD